MAENFSNNIKYIGVDDLDIDLFEGQYKVPEGMSYNSYLILDEKVAVMDTVDARKTSDWLANLKKELGARTPDFLIVQHMEPDHAGSITAFTEQSQRANILHRTGCKDVSTVFRWR